MLGCPAAVMDTVSPSQLIPSEIQRMWTSSTPAALVFSGHGYASIPVELLQVQVSSSSESTNSSSPSRDLDVQAPAVPSSDRGKSGSGGSPRRTRGRPPRPVPPRSPACAPRARCPRATSSKANVECGGHHLAQVPDLHLDARDRAVRRACRRRSRPSTGLSQARALVLSRSSVVGRRRAGPSPAGRRKPSRRAPSRAARSSPRRSRSRARNRVRRAALRAPRRRASGATKATSLPSFATYIGSMPSSSAAPATAGSTGTSASRTIIATPRRARQLVQHRGHAAPGGVAHAAQRRARGVEQRVDGRPQRAGVGLDVGLEARALRGRA